MITIWNAHRNQQQTINSIIATSPTGTVLNSEGSPNLLTVDTEIVESVDVLVEGPPVQNTTYEYVFSPDNSSNTTLLITGSRLRPIGLLYEHNWKVDFVLK